MKNETHRLGDYIREVNVRNRELRVTKPMGINIDKHFMPSVANIIGTDLSAYKLVYKNQFACNLMHVGRDEKIPMAMWNDANPIIVSPAYFVFEITKTEDLLPEYLMMWFRRAEFDRNAWFYTDADVRGGMNKDALLDMRFPIPTLARQREIVSEYETLTRRIRLNNQMIEKLEATAQALYHKTFVAGIDKQNLPDGTLGDLVTPQKGRNIVREECIEGNVPVIAGGKTPSCFHNQSNTGAPVVTISASGANAGYVGLHFNKVWAADCSYIDVDIFPYIYYIYVLLSMSQERLYSMQEGTGQPHIYPRHIMSLSITLPSNDAIRMFHEKVTPFFRKINLKQQENIKLTELQSLLLAKMGK